MCGIFGYIGKNNATENILNGLKRMEYRGYDSWGVAVVESKKIQVIKKVGAIGDLTDLKTLPFSNIGIGHTRWATHGGVTNTNAHPHFASDNSFVLAQNGIVENYQEIRDQLKKNNHKFITETDTEVIVRLVEEKLKKTNDIRVAIRKAFLDLQGRNTIIVLMSLGNRVIAVRNGSPLVIGIGDEEHYFASDTLSFADKTDKVMFIEDLEMIDFLNGDLHLFDVTTDKGKKVKISKINHKEVNIDKEGYDHYMLKEIVEQKHTIRESVQYTYKELLPLVSAVKEAETVYTLGSGTASFAAGQIAYFLRSIAGIKAVELKAYEMDSYKNIFTKDDLIIAVSQSGETADTIEALEMAKNKKVQIASVVNMIGSTITRMSKYKYFSRSGPEICVASTKAFTAQISWGLLLAATVAGDHAKMQATISSISYKLEQYFNKELFLSSKAIVRKLIPSEHFFVLGRGQNRYIALESALKVKEISYKHFEGFAAGELKHGVIALIEKGTPVFIISSNDHNKENMLSATAEVKARGAYVIGIGQQNNELFDEFVETIDTKGADCLTNVIPFQLLSYFLALELGLDPDKPRNLAKSVTVK